MGGGDCQVSFFARDDEYSLSTTVNYVDMYMPSIHRMFKYTKGWTEGEVYGGGGKQIGGAGVQS